MESDLLEVLCCPITHQSLRLADPALLAARSPGATWDSALIREDGKMLYPVVNGIPLLLAEEGIPL